MKLFIFSFLIVATLTGCGSAVNSSKENSRKEPSLESTVELDEKPPTCRVAVDFLTLPPPGSTRPSPWRNRVPPTTSSREESPKRMAVRWNLCPQPSAYTIDMVLSKSSSPADTVVTLYTHTTGEPEGEKTLPIPPHIPKGIYYLLVSFYGDNLEESRWKVITLGKTISFTQSQRDSMGQ